MRLLRHPFDRVGRYSKEEHLTDFDRFDYLIHESDSVPGFRLLEAVEGLDRVDLKAFSMR